MRVEVAYGTAERQALIALEVEEGPEGATVARVLRVAAAREPFSRLPLESMPVGVFGRPVERDTVLGPGDRLELYRPLTMDPKEARRRRAG